jgi:hypothetical protein
MAAFKAMRNGHVSVLCATERNLDLGCALENRTAECGLLDVCFASDSGQAADILGGPGCADFVAEVGDCNGEATPPILWNGLSQPPCLRRWALPGG